MPRKKLIDRAIEEAPALLLWVLAAGFYALLEE